ncbi:MAG: 5'-methylthioadenosine/S-adenosylhomocysteine nucleosidase [Verrucomicrobiae bacterium]|nr:5'-methylthioadenosine/S-adenosylhomocysteine nucleosidase [Verrucomicrobiae bacterium]
MIAILVAVKQELNPILRRANAPHIIRQEHLDFYEGTLAGQPVALLALGVGKECARIAAEMTIKCYRPDLVISAGFGGGLQNQLNDGDIVIGTEVLDLCADDGMNVRWRSTQALTHHAELTPTGTDSRIHFGKILTADEMVLKAATKARIGKATDAYAVDMETSAVAAVAAAHETDFLAVRCITDNAHENLPTEFNDFFVVGQLQPSRIIAACARRPKLVMDLARLGYRANQAGNNLARFLEQAVTQLHLPAREL